MNDDSIPNKPQAESLDFTYNRRQFLKNSIMGTAILSLSPILATGCSGYQPVSGLEFFTNKEFTIAKKIAEAVLPGNADTDTLTRRLDQLLMKQYPWIQEDFRAGLLFLEHGSPLLNLTFSKFSRLEALEARNILIDWMDSNIALLRALSHNLKAAFSFFYYSQEEIWKEIGYDGPFLDAINLRLQ